MTGKKLFIASVHAKVSSDNDKISFQLTEKIFDAGASFPRPRVSGRRGEVDKVPPPLRVSPTSTTHVSPSRPCCRSQCSCRSRRT